MDIDWILAIAVFLIFVSWSFTFFFSFIRFDQGYLNIANDIEMEKVMDFLEVDTYSLPVEAYSSSGQSGTVLKTGYIWYHGNRNTTRVSGGGSLLPCRIVGNESFWQADLSPGENHFTIEFCDLEENTSSCNGTFPTAGANQTVPWALEHSEMVSLSRINNMTSSGYDEFRELVGMTQDFSLEILGESTNVTFGANLTESPDNVFVRERNNTIWETKEEVSVRFALW